MSSDYQMIAMFSMALSLSLYPVVFGKWDGLYTTWDLGVNALLLILFCDRVMELHQIHTFIICISYGMIAGLYGGTYEGILRPYVQGRVLKYAYCMHIGLWTGLVAWATRVFF